MTEPINAYPLAWPAGWKRTTYGRKAGSFGKKTSNGFKNLTPGDGAVRILEELGKLGVERHDIVISTNLKLRMDGLPKDDFVADPGAVVYWMTKKDDRRCMAVDAYHTVADNLAAIAATLDALRAIERHGGAAILDRAFTGFTALPAPGKGIVKKLRAAGKPAPDFDNGEWWFAPLEPSVPAEPNPNHWPRDADGREIEA